MKTLDQSLKGQRNAIIFWRIFLLISLLLILSLSLADKVIQFELSAALAFIGLVTGITSLAMIKVYKNRKKMVESIYERENFIDEWICPDRYEVNKGTPIPVMFSKNGVFYAGMPYCVKSYDCLIKKAEIINDEGPALSISYTVPSSRAGAFRHKSLLNIPIPDGKMPSAQYLAEFYTDEGKKNK